MRIITIAARKGGVGKTTLATHLSVLAAAGGPTLLFDTDPQRSLAWWWRLRSADSPQLVECASRDLAKVIDAAREAGVKACIIDTPPHAEDSILSAMRLADLVLVPTRPGPFDLAAVATTLELARSIGKAPLAVLNHAPPQTGFAEPAIVTEAREAIRLMGAEVADVAIAQRVALSHAVISGQTVNEYEPKGKAALEIAALWAEILKRIGGRK